MTLAERIATDMKVAMKERQDLCLSTLRMLMAAMQNKTIAKRGASEGGTDALTDEELVLVIKAEAKKRRDAIEGFEKGGRVEMAEKERAEMEVLEVYLPAELPDAELERIASEVVAGIPAVTAKEFGRVMGEVMKRVKGQASGERVSAMVRRMLEI